MEVAEWRTTQQRWLRGYFSYLLELAKDVVLKKKAAQAEHARQLPVEEQFLATAWLSLSQVRLPYQAWDNYRRGSS